VAVPRAGAVTAASSATRYEALLLCNSSQRCHGKPLSFCGAGGVKGSHTYMMGCSNGSLTLKAASSLIAFRLEVYLRAYAASGMPACGFEYRALDTPFQHSGFFAHSEIILPLESLCKASFTSCAQIDICCSSC